MYGTHPKLQIERSRLRIVPGSCQTPDAEVSSRDHFHFTVVVVVAAEVLNERRTGDIAPVESYGTLC